MGKLTALEHMKSSLEAVKKYINNFVQLATDAISEINDRFDGAMIKMDIATDNVQGGIKTGYSTNGRYYPVKVDAKGNAYVYVPWSDTNTTYNAATTSQSGLMSASDKTKLNKLTEQESGTWTPASSNISTTGTPRYIRDGNLVFVKSHITFNSSTTAKSVDISGLPFAASVTVASIAIYPAKDKTFWGKVQGTTLTIRSTESLANETIIISGLYNLVA